MPCDGTNAILAVVYEVSVHELAGQVLAIAAINQSPASALCGQELEHFPSRITAASDNVDHGTLIIICDVAQTMGLAFASRSRCECDNALWRTSSRVVR